MTQKHVLKKTPRTVLYAIGAVAILVLVGAVVAELFDPGSVQRIREATETVLAEIGLGAAALAAVVTPVLALLNLSDDEDSKDPNEPAPVRAEPAPDELDLYSQP